MVSIFESVEIACQASPIICALEDAPFPKVRALDNPLVGVV